MGQNCMYMLKMQLKLQNMFPFLEILAFEPVAGISLSYDENTCDLYSTFYQAVLGFWIWLREMFSYTICPRLMENCDKSGAVQVSAVFGIR